MSSDIPTILKIWQRGRHKDSLTDLLRPHIPRLYRLAYRLTGNEADSEDLLQDLVIKLHGRAGEIAALDKPGIWLARVLYRLYIDAYRRALRRPVAVSESEVGADHDNPFEGPADDEARQPERLTDRRLEAQRLQAALDSLNQDQRAVVILHDVEGYSLPELEYLLSLPVGTLKSRLHRGRRRLRKLLMEGTF